MKIMLAVFLVIVFPCVTGTADGREIPSEGVGLYNLEVQPLVPAPSETDRWDAWRAALVETCQQRRRQLSYDGSLYQRADFGWVPSCYSCCFAMMYDQRFYDLAAGRYTVDRFLEEGVGEFGGYDAVVLWHAYPRIGFDDRNQWDFYRDMPGGLDGLRALSRALHRGGVKVFINYNPWDTGTRREQKSDAEMLAELVAAIEADGIFLDTLHEGMEGLREQLDAARAGVVLESELTLPTERIGDHHMSWAQWFSDGDAPGVLWNKWFERRHMMHQIQRWNHDHTGELHTAWMNGAGMLVWENVFGSAVGWCPRDRSILRLILPIQRRYGRLFAGEGWTPLIPTEKPEVYASQWQGEGVRLWTLVNRSQQSVEGVLLRVPHVEGTRCFDLFRGRQVGHQEAGTMVLEGALPTRGVGAFVAGDESTLGAEFGSFLAGQAAVNRRANWDVASPSPVDRLRSVEHTRRQSRREIPAGMVVVPGVRLRMKTRYRNRECGFYHVPGQSPVAHPSRGLHQMVSFEREMQLESYAMDATPVTNAQFAEFLRETGYRPRDEKNLLKHWLGRQIPPGLEDHPVVYVDLQDAQAYARWAGKRLPTEAEWQYAAQGPDTRAYPWGNQWEEGHCNGGASGGTTSVTAFPQGRSAFGCYDMCGNTWEWTESERRDGRTRFCILKGGSYYQAKGSHWYADGGPQSCDFAAKFLLMWPGLDRCATIGFRCVVDLAEQERDIR